MKKLLPVIIAVLLVAAVIGWYKSFRADKVLAQEREKYRTMVVETEILKGQSDARIAELARQISAQSDIVSGLKADILVKNQRISALSSQLDELQNTEPPTTPEIESLPIVINLRGQVARLTEMFNLSQEAGKLKDQTIIALENKFTLQVAITDEIVGQLDREHALRLASESLANRAISRYKSSKFLNKAAIVAVAGAVAYGLLK